MRLRAFIDILIVAFVIIMTATLVRTQPLTSQGWVLHTQRVYMALQEVELAVKTAESAQRGYLLTYNEDFLSPYRVAYAQMNRSLKKVAFLTEENKLQQDRLAKLQSALDKKFREMDATINADEWGGQSALALIRTGRGENLMNDAHAVIVEMQQTEDILLQQRDQTARNHFLILMFGLVIILVRDLAAFARRIESYNPLDKPSMGR